MWDASEGMGWVMILGAVFWLTVILGIVYLAATFSRRGEAPPRPVETPLDIARRRYARGEISQEEFERIRKQLSQ